MTTSDRFWTDTETRSGRNRMEGKDGRENGR